MGFSVDQIVNFRSRFMTRNARAYSAAPTLFMRKLEASKSAFPLLRFKKLRVRNKGCYSTATTLKSVMG